MSGSCSRNRREFLQLAAAAGVGGAYVISAQGGQRQEEPAGPPVPCAVIGAGLQGRRLLGLLTASPQARVVAVGEIYPPYAQRAQRMAPDARIYSDMHQLLSREQELEAVFVATPTHVHRETVEAVLKSGRPAYCEAPMAATADDARAMARAAEAAGQILAVGLQLRSNRNFGHALDFVEIEAIGKLALDNAGYHVNSSWRRAASDRAYEEQLNWRLDPRISLGLLGELGVHCFDTTLRSIQELPTAVTCFGSLVKWQDQRQIPDTVQAVFEFPSGFQSHFEATLTNSYGGQSHLLHGTAGSILLTEERCWLFKEVDAPTFGWEVYASRERVVSQDGIVLVANATKLLEQNALPSSGAAGAEGSDSLELAVQDFLAAVRQRRAPAAGAAEGVNSLVMAEMALRSLERKTRISIETSAFKT